MHLPIYLDYNSTTPVDETVLETMLPYFSTHYGNASSKTHTFGWLADGAVKHARQQVADCIGAEENEIIFTSGSTESINLAIKGIYEVYREKGNHIVTVQTEHNAVLDVCENLEKKGAKITYLKVNQEGLIDIQELEEAITDKTILVCVMMANNETGVIQDIESISKIVHAKKSLLFCDATQAIGKANVNVNDLGVDLLCVSAHKIYGPKGVGALYIRRKNPRVTLQSLIDGGGHERGLRSGTLNVPGIVGLGKACELAKMNYWDFNEKVSKLRAHLEHQLLDIEGLRINGSTRSRLYNTSNIYFPKFKASQIISKLTNIAVSAGSSCNSAIAKPSHVLTAMGMSELEAYSCIRFSLGKYTTEEEIKVTIDSIKKLYA